MWSNFVLAALGVSVLAVPGVHASAIVDGVVETEDREDWIAWVGEFDVVDFVGFSEGTLLFDQYADLGVLFSDGNDTVRVNQNYLDGFGAFGGLFSDEGLTMVFDEPQSWIGLDYPGFIQFQLFREGELVYESSVFRAPQGGIGFGSDQTPRCADFAMFSAMASMGSFEYCL